MSSCVTCHSIMLKPVATHVIFTNRGNPPDLLSWFERERVIRKREKRTLNANWYSFDIFSGTYFSLSDCVALIKKQVRIPEARHSEYKDFVPSCVKNFPLLFSPLLFLLCTALQTVFANDTKSFLEISRKQR